MSENISEKEHLYDPMFAKKPPTGWEDSEKGGFFGKAVVKKAVFIFFLVIAIGTSLFFSFRALGKETYTYDNTEIGLQLSEFNGGEKDTVLYVEYKADENGQFDTSAPVASVRNYAVCCNEYLEFIFIGKDVKELEYNCFYYCNNLKAIFVDSENPNYTSVDGVLYSKDMTEIIIHPIKHHEYVAALKMGASPIETQADCEKFRNEFEERIGYNEEERSEKVIEFISNNADTYEIPDTVTKIAPFCFNYCSTLTYIEIPDGVKEFGQMAFFKCSSLKSIYLPDGLETIGSDAVSYCREINYIYVPASVKTIGHHAFFDDLGCEKIYMGAESKDDFKAGESWLPKQGERSNKNVEVVYGQERRVN